MALADGSDATPLLEGAALTSFAASGITTTLLGHPEVLTVSIKIPEVWTDDTELWFSHIKASFSKARMTIQNAKFARVIAEPPQATTALIGDNLRARPQHQAYDRLKT